ncbi:MAG: type II secretion system protein [Minisyncoccia bacterium]
MNKKKSGFSLIELLVVIAIMTILTTMVYVSVNSTRSKSRDQQRISSILKIKLALEYYYNLYGYYPKKLDELYSGESPLPISSPGKITLDDLTPPKGYPDNGYYYVALMVRGSSDICNSYHLYTKLESKTSTLDSRAGYNSTNDDACDDEPDTILTKDVTLPDNNLIYDVRPQ